MYICIDIYIYIHILAWHFGAATQLMSQTSGTHQTRALSNAQRGNGIGGKGS